MKQKNKLLVVNIGWMAGMREEKVKHVAGSDMGHVNILHNAWLKVEDGRFCDFGTQDKLETATSDPEKDGPSLVIDAQGGAVLPSFCDSHTHLVYAGSREREFVDHIQGLDYAEIARRGGGILNSADVLHAMTEDELFNHAMRRLDEIAMKGTGAVEIKSGYGLNTADELKMLRVIDRLKHSSKLRIVSTFLGAHAVGRAYLGRQTAYVDMVVNEMLPEVARSGLADFVDVFCDQGFFTPKETDRILNAAAKYGLRGKIHGQELADSGGVEVAIRNNAQSVDHLESMTEQDIRLLAADGVGTIPTVLPGTSFFLNMPYAPARRMIDAGLPVALASDYNPGSTPSGDMKFVMSLACIKMGLLPEEAFNAATVNSAAAMGLNEQYGSIRKGSIANFYITPKIPSLAFLPYAYTTPVVERVFLNGVEMFHQTPNE